MRQGWGDERSERKTKKKKGRRKAEEVHAEKKRITEERMVDTNRMVETNKKIKKMDVEKKRKAGERVKVEADA